VDEESATTGRLRPIKPYISEEWDTTMTGSGEQALKTLASDYFDVIVAGLRMRDMDSGEMLLEVAKKHPQMVRIVLAAQSDREAVPRSFGAAHLCLSKPCGSECLKQAITRACHLRDALFSDSLNDSIVQLKKLPMIPPLYLEIMDCLKSADCTSNKMGEIISHDMGMTVTLLQLVNSPFFGHSRNVTNLGKAVSLLGFDTVRAIALSSQIFAQFDQRKLQNNRLRGLWEHSLLIGAVARDITLAENQERKMVDDAFIAGLLHDIGKLVIAYNYPEGHKEILEKSFRERISLEEAEVRVLGASHAEIGGYLLDLWGFPYPVVEAVFFNHAPRESVTRKFAPLAAVHAADYICAGLQADKSELFCVPLSIDFDYLREIGLAERTPVWESIFNYYLDIPCAAWYSPACAGIEQ